MSDTVEMRSTYITYPDGYVREIVTIGEKVIYDGPSRVVFYDVGDWPWESLNQSAKLLEDS